ncbi:MAG TPA: hypothetical protein VJR92_09720 [Gemmatimonadaceae bacterium]|nr:hypothetical protein [Gemmatimonadaceae bacterium]
MTRLRFTMTLCGAALLSAGSVTSAGAQISRVQPLPCTEAPRFLIITPQVAGGLRARQDAENQLRQRLKADISTKEACIIPKPEADGILTQSKFPIDTAMSAVDALALGQPLRADEVLLSEMKNSGGTFQYSGMLVLQRDQWLRDRVPAAVADPTQSGAAKQFTKSVEDLRKQLPHELACYRHVRANKAAEAEAAARAGIAAYPEAVISRLCLASALEQQHKTDAMLATINEVLQRDSLNVAALMFAMRGYFEKTDTNKFASVASRIVALDPTNSQVESIIGTLAAWRRSDIALPMIERILKEDPENKNLRDIEFRLEYFAGKWDRAAIRAETLAMLDTARVDTTFIQRVVSAYANDSQPNKVLEWLTKGTKKFPTNVPMAFSRAQQLKRMGQTQAAIDEYKRLLGLAPRTAQIRLYIANYFEELQQTDSANAWLRRAGEQPEDRPQAGSLAIGSALRQFNSANAKMKDTAQKAASLQEFKNAIPLFAFADSLNPADPRGKFYWGYAAYIIGADVVSTLDAATRLKPPVRPTCEQVKEARAWIDTANEKIGQGGRADPANAPKLFQSIQEVLFPWLEQWNKTLKCT